MQDLDRLKAQVSPGDLVSFEFRGRSLRGTVTTLGRKYAGVSVSSGDDYRVPYSLLQPLGARTDHSGREQGALETCRKLLRQHGLRGWSVCLGDAASQAGVCDYRKKQISLSRLFLRKATEAEIRDTILHEIAHALAGYKHGHDAVWRKIAREIGCSGRRCHEVEFSLPRWIMLCPKGCFVTTRRRRARGRICLNCKKPIRYVPWTKELERTLNDGSAANSKLAAP